MHFASEVYENDSCSEFSPKAGKENLSKGQLKTLRQIHKAISIIQFKLEGQIINRNPDFDMSSRTILDQIDYQKGEITIEGKSYKLLDSNFPTVDPNNPFELTKAESDLMNKLQESFLKSEKLQRHINYLYNKGSMYLSYNGLLLFHGAVPLKEDGSIKEVTIANRILKGKALLDFFDKKARQAYYLSQRNIKKESNLDLLWYLWCGADSPLFGKKKMATFERYFLKEKETHKEDRNPYFSYRDNTNVIQSILLEFGLNPKSGHIVNGHVPVKVRKGENPVKANGQLIVIDGGMSKAYQKVTGIAGYTLINNSYGIVLVAHHAFESQKIAIQEGKDMVSRSEYLVYSEVRKRVEDTDIGKDLMQEILDLKMLLASYHYGIIKERKRKV
jgi:fructose-1,6-bisphosphatase-3